MNAPPRYSQRARQWRGQRSRLVLQAPARLCYLRRAVPLAYLAAMPASPQLVDDDVSRRLIELRHDGKPWQDCARELGCSINSLKTRARRLRDARQWKLTNGKAARGAPSTDRGRPRAEVPRIPVSIRVTPSTAEALRGLALTTEMRLGEVVAEAMQREVERAAKTRPSRTPLGLDPGERVDLLGGHRTETISVNVPRPLYDEVIALAPKDPAMSTIFGVVSRLLVDLNYRFVDCDN